MNLETIQSMWEKDSHIDPDELHTASLVVPTLHAKYYQLFNDLRLLRAKAKKTYQKVCLLYTSPSPRDPKTSRMPSSA